LRPAMQQDHDRALTGRDVMQLHVAKIGVVVRQI
jgi:hypothetical protein